VSVRASLNQLTRALTRWKAAAERRVVGAALLRVYRSRTPAVAAGQRLLFLCNGNVCRSALAAAQARILLGGEVALVDSAGLGDSGGRQSPELARKVAAEMGLDLANHTSLAVHVDQIRWADCVFVMDRLTVLRTWRRFPEARRKLFLLDAPREVPDPYGHNERKFKEVFQQIRASIERLAEQYSQGR
jgi:protein-tyrosine phosphatase